MSHDIQYAKRTFYSSKCLLFIAMLFITLLLSGTAVAYKTVSLVWLTIPGSSIIFPLTYMLSDIITEVYGYSIMRQIIWFAVICGYIFTLLISFVINLPSPIDWHLQNGFNMVFRNTWLFTNVVTFGMVVGLFINSYVMAKWKIITHGKFFWFRSLVATLLGDVVQITIMVVLAFSSTSNFNKTVVLVFSIYCYRAIYVVVTTFPAFIIMLLLKKIENLDVYDTKTNFNPFIMRI